MITILTISYNLGVQHKDNEESDNNSYVFTHTLESGPTKEMFYGLRLATCTAMEPSILAKAQEYAIALDGTQNEVLVIDLESFGLKIEF